MPFAAGPLLAQDDQRLRMQEHPLAAAERTVPIHRECQGMEFSARDMEPFQITQGSYFSIRVYYITPQWRGGSMGHLKKCKMRPS